MIIYFQAPKTHSGRDNASGIVSRASHSCAHHHCQASVVSPSISEPPAPSNTTSVSADFIRWFDGLSNKDVPIVGGKNASLGEMVCTLKAERIDVPDGFAITAHAYREYLAHNQLQEAVAEQIDALNSGNQPLDVTGRKIRQLIQDGDIPKALEREIESSYASLGKRYHMENPDVAVRSSATAEDLPDASFAGQQESYLNVEGTQELLYTCKRCFASLFTDRAISYREQRGFDHMSVALSIGVQKMVRSDKGSSGVMFTLDTETGFRDMIVINAAYGLGETVVQGMVTPDEYRVFKPLLDQADKCPIIEKVLGSKMIKMIYGDGWIKRTQTVNTNFKERQNFVLNDDQILKLSRWANTIAKHYGRPMDIEWAIDGLTKELFIVQARPETVKSQQNVSALTSARLITKEKPKVIVDGLAIGHTIRNGKVALLKDMRDAKRFDEGQILVASSTDPDWVPLMKKAAAIITDHGGRTSHAAIVSRELGIPAVIGTGSATHHLYAGQEVTVDCAHGERGRIYNGLLEYEEHDLDIGDLPKTKTKILMNIASPEAAFRWWQVPCQGIGLARMEFIINNLIKLHPMAVAHHDVLNEGNLKLKISKMTGHYPTPRDYFVSNLAMGIAQIAASRYPDPVIVRLSDFKSNEYAKLIGGEVFERDEENPMLGFRGASRYYSDAYKPGFALECAALLKARNEIGLDNLIVMVPFCRTPDEADRVLEVMKENGLKRGENGLKIYVMAEIPSNIILAKQFAERFDGFSIGSNDLTQLTLGVDRDSDQLAHLFDERNGAVTALITKLIEDAHSMNTPVGLCGQGPSDHPDFAEFLVKTGIDSISLNPDSVIEVTRRIAELEHSLA